MTPSAHLAPPAGISMLSVPIFMQLTLQPTSHKAPFFWKTICENNDFILEKQKQTQNTYKTTQGRIVVPLIPS